MDIPLCPLCSSSHHPPNNHYLVLFQPVFIHIFRAAAINQSHSTLNQIFLPASKPKSAPPHTPRFTPVPPKDINLTPHNLILPHLSIPQRILVLLSQYHISLSLSTRCPPPIDQRFILPLPRPQNPSAYGSAFQDNARFQERGFGKVSRCWRGYLIRSTIPGIRFGRGRR